MVDKHRVTFFLRKEERKALEARGSERSISGNLYAKDIILNELSRSQNQKAEEKKSC